MKGFLTKLLKNKKYNLIAILVLLFSSLLPIFPIGSFHHSSTVEKTSEYLADVASNHTVSGTYVAMLIEPNERTNKKIYDTEHEYRSMHGVFREKIATYAGTINAEKSHVIKLKELGDDTNFSFLNVDVGYSTPEYKNEDGDSVFKTAFYPLELMFYSEHKFDYPFFYISQSRADSILEKRGLPHSSLEDYSVLLNQFTIIEIDGVDYEFIINNIYYEKNYFYRALKEVMGEFFLGGNRVPEQIKRQALFFLRNYKYQNKFYIDYATRIYPESDFKYRVLGSNFKDGFIIDKTQVVFFPTTALDSLSILFLVVSVIFLVCSLGLMFFGSFEVCIKSTLLVGTTVLLPYLIFWIIYLIFDNVLLFSGFSTSCVLYCLLGLIIFYFIIFLVKRSRRKNHSS